GTLPWQSADFTCPGCGGIVDVRYQWQKLPGVPGWDTWRNRRAQLHLASNRSGVWRFRELLPFADEVELVTIMEGNTPLLPAPRLAEWIGLNGHQLYLQHEGMNPSGSFKDNGMTAAFTHARQIGARQAACASTGNTSASLALFASTTGLLRAVVFVGSGKLTQSKLAQALDHAALTLQIDGNFDDALARVREVAPLAKLYVVNSINPFRLEGQKTVMYRIVESLGQVPDWIITPGGNLGNTAAFGKAFMELQELGLITKVPRLGVIVAEGARTFSELVNEHQLCWNGGQWDQTLVDRYYTALEAAQAKPHTVASAIAIHRPANLPKALRALDFMHGVVRAVSDDAILDAKAQIARTGFGCEPASAASVAGARQLLAEGVIQPKETVVCLLTAHALKDPDVTVQYHMGSPAGRFATQPVTVANEAKAILAALQQ
ncbi:MAG TPA: threonine synthase, partial [Gemmatales bacterium]|nr:threonine synthase [Gemmatales bacterium]